MDLSIVSGTYNRINHLQKMVNSVRQSIQYNLSYEIVLVDGGSQDGTIEWCKSQPDIRLIEQGELLGAVKAFNEGAYTAYGDYVILANDDIEFISDSIWQAWLWMQLHSECGQGCFYQDRDRQHLLDDNKWQVEKMPVNLSGKQGMMYYGQICIVPKWLGDRVGWWCDEDEYLAKSLEYRDTNIKPLHTYAGDNELSSKIYDLGFKINPVPGTKIHDNEAQDTLRKINNISGSKDPRAVKGHHPDSWSWGRKWRDQRTNIVGAVIKDTPIISSSFTPKERILYLPIFEPGWTIQKEQKRGLREALERIALTIEYDYVTRYHKIGKEAMMREIIDHCLSIMPTIVLTQLHNGANIDHNDIDMLRHRFPDIYFVNWNGDYWPENLLSDEGKKLAASFDLMTSVNLNAVERYNQLGINARYWQIGYEPDGRVDQITHRYDVVFLASGYSPKRQKFVKWLRGKNWFSFGLWGSGWKEGWAQGQNLYDFRSAAGIYKGAKIALGDSQWPETGFVSNRVMQILAAGGCAMAHQWFRGMEDLGLIDNETCIIWRNFDDLEIKLRYYLSNEGDRKRIAENGEKLALERHSFDVRVQELFEMIRPREISYSNWRW